MGNTSPFKYKYSVEVTPPPNSNETGIRRASTHPNEVVSNFIHRDVNSCWDLFQAGVDLNGEGNCLGARSRVSDKIYGNFEWLTYKQVENLALRIGSSMLERGIVSSSFFPEESYEGAREMKLLGIYSKNRVEWFLCEQAANAYGLTLVPLYDTLGEEAIVYSLKLTKLELVACGMDTVEKLLNMINGNQTCLKRIILFDSVSEDVVKLAETRGIELAYFSDLKEPSSLRKPEPGTRDTVATLCLTSGTTGNPKCVILTQGNFIATVCASIRGPLDCPHGLKISSEDVHISYLPLAHVFERAVCNIAMTKGASIGIYSGDVLRLIEDLKLLKPTLFISVPRLFNRMDDRVANGIKSKSPFTRLLFEVAMNRKLKRTRADSSVTHSFWDAMVFNKIKQIMGGRLRYMLAGGAPLNMSVQERIKVLFCAPVCEGYGLSETLGTSFIALPDDPVCGQLGGPLPCLEFKIESAPEREYLVSDPHPSGELLLRGPALSQGYLCNKEETRRVFDSEGWFHTGDIVVLLPNGAIKIIDRKKNIFKLAQGEYVAPEKIESAYMQSHFVSQLFVYGEPSRAELVAVVAPDPIASREWAARTLGEEKELSELCEMAKFRALLREDMEQAATRANLKGFEKVKAFKLWPQGFTVENNLITPTFKIKRHAAKKAFSSLVQEMYVELQKRSPPARS